MFKDLNKCRDVELVSEEEDSSPGAGVPAQQTPTPSDTVCAVAPACVSPLERISSPDYSAKGGIGLPSGFHDFMQFPPDSRRYRINRAVAVTFVAFLFVLFAAVAFCVDHMMHLRGTMHYVLMSLGGMQLALLGLFGIHLIRPRWYMNVPPVVISTRRYRLSVLLWILPVLWIMTSYSSHVFIADATGKDRVMPPAWTRALGFFVSTLSVDQAACDIANQRDLALWYHRFGDARKLQMGLARHAPRLKLPDNRIDSPILKQALSKVKKAKRSLSVANLARTNRHLVFDATMAAVILDRNNERAAAEELYVRFFQEMSATGSRLIMYMPLADQRWDRLTAGFNDQDKSLLEKKLLVAFSKQQFGTKLVDLRPIVIDCRPDLKARTEAETVLPATDVVEKLQSLPPAVLERDFQWAKKLWRQDNQDWYALRQRLSADGPLPHHQGGKHPWRPFTTDSLGSTQISLRTLLPVEYAILTSTQEAQLEHALSDVASKLIKPVD